MNENQTSISKSHTNNTPFHCNQNEKRKKKNNQREKQTSNPKRKGLRTLILTKIEMKRSVGL
jgi:hypothetical protein